MKKNKIVSMIYKKAKIVEIERTIKMAGIQIEKIKGSEKYKGERLLFEELRGILIATLDRQLREKVEGNKSLFECFFCLIDAVGSTVNRKNVTASFKFLAMAHLCNALNAEGESK